MLKNFKYLAIFILSFIISAFILMSYYSCYKVEVVYSLKMSKGIFKGESGLYYILDKNNSNPLNHEIYKNILINIAFISSLSNYLEENLTDTKYVSLEEINAYCLSADFVLNYKPQTSQLNKMYQPILAELQNNQPIWIDILSKNRNTKISYSCLEKLKLQGSQKAAQTKHSN